MIAPILATVEVCPESLSWVRVGVGSISLDVSQAELGEWTGEETVFSFQQFRPGRSGSVRLRLRVPRAARWRRGGVGRLRWKSIRGRGWGESHS